ncbi:MAG: acyclic terpene utilization AtuA family protein [Lautropia sp.]
MTLTAGNAAAHGKVVRIGCGSGFWGDTPEGVRQMILCDEIEYFIGDYLAEITMSILARAMQRNPMHGYAPDFVTSVIKPYAKEIALKGLKVVVNAGGLNLLGCKAEVERELASQGVSLKVAVVLGDDLMPQIEKLRNEGLWEMFSGESLPVRPLSANAYLGAFPIAAALDRGADIVITGRCVDSALALGPLIHEFGWKEDQFDMLAAGSLVGHVIECGPQCTGGIYTDWEEVADGWADIGFPIAECRDDGSFVVTKPKGTGGKVSWGTIAEQITYETDDPETYVLPDVVCDISRVTVEEVGPDRVRVSGAKGKPCTNTYKVSVTYQDGYRCLATLLIKGISAVAKARAVGAAILKRTRSILEREGLGDFSDTSVEVLGAEDTYGPHARISASREVILKVAVRHRCKQAAEIFSGEIASASTGMAQGIAGVMGGRPAVQPVIRLHSSLVSKARVSAEVRLAGESVAVRIRSHGIDIPPRKVSEAAGDSTGARPQDVSDVVVSLATLAYGRSGDKGDVSNIAVLARTAAYLPFIKAQVTADAVAEYMAHAIKGPVERFDWPGLRGVNLVLHGALGGGGTSSLRYDPQGKAHGQMLMDFPVRVPAGILDGCRS